MELLIKNWPDLVILGTLFAVVFLYFRNNPLAHSKKFMMRRFVNWFPLGMTYAFLYMARYNLSVSKNALGTAMPIENFGIIFGVGTAVYGFSFLLNGPLVDKIGGKKGIVIAALGAAVMNALMGLVTYLYLNGKLAWNLTVTFSVLYGLNMFFQSYGAVSIIKVKAYWFHVRERGVFGAIFGTLISFGAYFAFDWGNIIVKATTKALPIDKTGTVVEHSPFVMFLRNMFAVDVFPTDSYWIIFLAPAFILVFWALLDMILLKDTPAQANFDDFDPHDASSGEDQSQQHTIGELIKKIFTSPIMLTIAAIEFTSGVLRNGIMQWYPVYAKEIPQIGAEFLSLRWGFLIAVFGIIGGFTGGLVSDHFFHSRRGPPAAIMCGVMFGCTIAMCFTLGNSPWAFGIASLVIIAAVIAVHSLMSGTAAADFGGRKMTATASGIVDGFVYLGSAIQSFSIGYLAKDHWSWWPMFLVPFTLVGLAFAVRMWNHLPDATRRYLLMVEKIDLTVRQPGRGRFRLRRKTAVAMEE